jgi:hypothetical protein
MNDILFFLVQSWKNIWKQRTIWLFSGLTLIIQFLPVYQTEQEPEGIETLISLVRSLLFLVLTMIQFVAVPYLAYRFSTGNQATIRETLSAVWKYSWRVPCLFVVASFFSTQPFRNPTTLFITLLLFSLFGAILDFSLFEFFTKDSGIRQTLKEVWQLFTAHFYVLAALGIIMLILSTIVSAALGVTTVLIQSGFDVDSLRELNYLNPSASLEGNVLFLLINGIWQTISYAWHSSIFALAYLKYSGVETLSVKSGEAKVMY